MAKRVNQYQHVFLRRLILPWITVLVLVFLLLFSAIYYQGKQNRIRSLDHQARQSTLALKNHFLAALDQFENIALIVQFGQQTPDISDAGLTKAEQALASYQYMQFLNTVKLGYPVVDSIWTVFDGFALTSNRTRYQINTSSIYAAMNETHGGGWVYPFQPYQLIGEGEDAAVLKYGNFIQNTVDFIIVAFCIFLMLKGINKLNRKKEEPAPAPEEPKGPTQEELLAEIRDLLKEKK